MACPEGAVGVVAISSRALVDVAIRAGGSPLKPIAKKLAKAFRKGTLGDAGARLRDADIGAPEEALEAAAASLDGLPIAAPWSEDLLLPLVIDSASCTGCGSCAKACSPGALLMKPQTPARIADARKATSVWESLPDTAGATIETLEPRLGKLASSLLSRHCAMALAGGNGSEPGSGAKVALRFALAMSEAALQPRVLGQIRRVKELRSDLDAAIRTELAAAMPTGASLDQALAGGEVSTNGTLTPKDRARLRGRATLSESLGALQQRLEQGSRGLGRARLGMVLAPDLAERWGVEFPYNPFQVPVVVAGAGSDLALAEGLLRGQFAQADEGEAHLRAASLDMKKTAPPPLHPPVMVVGGDELLHAPIGDLPMKLLVLCGDESPGELELLAMWRQGAFVAQTAIGSPGHCGDVLLAAFAHDGPAVVRIHAPTLPDSSAAVPTSAASVAEGRWPLWSLAPGAPLAELQLMSEASGVLSELVALPQLRETLRDEYEAREATLREELKAHMAAEKASEDVRFAVRLEERLMALAGLTGAQR